ITGDGTEPFARVLHMACDGTQWLFVDMADVNYVGSAGLAVAVKVSEKLRQAGGGMSLFGLSSNLKLLVETLGLDGYLNPMDRLEDAMNFLSNQDDLETPVALGMQISVDCKGDQNRQAELLAGLVHHGIPVVSFAGQQRNLEEVFLNVTQGRVQ
ncbi:MAG: STAS domain-containing protein, partial [Planctomycetota bacterium]